MIKPEKAAAVLAVLLAFGLALAGCELGAAGDEKGASWTLEQAGAELNSDGLPVSDTTGIKIRFSAEINDLKAAEIVISGAASKKSGALENSGGEWTVPIAVSGTGEVSVTIYREDAARGPKNVKVYKQAVFSYELGEISFGIFKDLSHTMTLDEWFLKVTGNVYSVWSQNEGVVLYRDLDMKIPATGTDTVSAETVICCEFFMNTPGKMLGYVTGTITLTDIPSPAPELYMDAFYGDDWWSRGQVDMSGVSGTTATLEWSLPAYEKLFKPNTQSRFTLYVEFNSGYHFETQVPARKVIGGGGSDAGSLGTVSIKTVTLSGTVNVTVNGEPVPYIEIYADYPVAGTLNTASLFSPGPDAPWSIMVASSNVSRDLQFRVIGTKKEDWSGIDDLLFDIYAETGALYVRDSDLEGITLDLGDIEY